MWTWSQWQEMSMIMDSWKKNMKLQGKEVARLIISRLTITNFEFLLTIDLNVSFTPPIFTAKAKVV